MKKLYSAAVVAIFAVFMGGCFSGKTASPELDQGAKTFAADPKMANVYLFRHEAFEGMTKIKVSVNKKLAGSTVTKTYFNWKLEPGAYVFTSSSENTSTLTLKVEAGKTYYIWQEVKKGFLRPRTLLKEVSEEEGQKGVRESKLLISEF